MLASAALSPAGFSATSFGRARRGQGFQHVSSCAHEVSWWRAGTEVGLGLRRRAELVRRSRESRARRRYPAATRDPRSTGHRVRRCREQSAQQSWTPLPGAWRPPSSVHQVFTLCRRAITAHPQSIQLQFLAKVLPQRLTCVAHTAGDRNLVLTTVWRGYSPLAGSGCDYRSRTRKKQRHSRNTPMPFRPASRARQPARRRDGKNGRNDRGAKPACDREAFAGIDAQGVAGRDLAGVAVDGEIAAQLSAA